jgi:SPP1 gp7 family putative phage head morphogenesis protein
MAHDESPAMALRDVMRKLSRRWQRNFDRGSSDLAAWFAIAAADRSDKALQEILRKAGFSVRFKLTAEANDAIQATIGEQISLIKSIGSQHLSTVEQLVMRSVSSGRDLSTLTKELEERFGVTRRRAALIARTENNKCTATITRVRQEGLGIRTAVWMHSHGGKEPRPSHVKASGQTYEVDKGMLIDGEYIYPGQLINCRCVSRSVIPGFD